ncbi:MAG: histidine phosphatase family protein [Actinomycetota bacterium]
MTTTILGVRHGEVHNPDGVIYAGLSGFGLSGDGRRQAAEVADALRGANVIALYASPLDRGIETARIISEAIGVEVIPDSRLEEWGHWHQWAGMTWEELRTKGRDAWEMYISDPGSVTSGESLAQLADRVEAWMKDVERDHPDSLAVGVSHLEPLRAILLRSLERPAGDLFGIEIGPGAAVRLAPEPDPTPLEAASIRRMVDASIPGTPRSPSL